MRRRNKIAYSQAIAERDGLTLFVFSIVEYDGLCRLWRIYAIDKQTAIEHMDDLGRSNYWKSWELV